MTLQQPEQQPPEPKAPEIGPAKSPHIDLPMPAAPPGPLTTPEQPIPIKE